MLKVGTKAPDFELPDQNGKLIKLSAFRNKAYVVLFFYPKDNTPGCSTESCSFRDNYDAFKALNVEIFGISSDSPDSHKAFAHRLKLTFSLLSDVSGAVRKRYDVKPTLIFMPGRATFVVDKEGIICYALSSQFNVERHIDETLQFVRSLPQISLNKKSRSLLKNDNQY